MGRAEREGEILTEKDRSKSRKISRWRPRSRKGWEKRKEYLWSVFSNHVDLLQRNSKIKCFPGPGGVTSRQNLPVSRHSFISTSFCSNLLRPAATCCPQIPEVIRICCPKVQLFYRNENLAVDLDETCPTHLRQLVLNQIKHLFISSLFYQFVPQDNVFTQNEDL